MKFESPHKRFGAVRPATPAPFTLSVTATAGGRTARRPWRGANARGKHRGQALLLAVLLMVFAALLGSTFITVVALNLNQTGRDRDKSEARLAAQAGLKTINQQITNSIEGEKWRPEMVSPPPSPSDPDYNTYYTPFEQAQGWALGYEYTGTAPTNEQKWQQLEAYKNTGGRVFVKFPDPRQLSSGDSPTFLAEVTKVTSGDAQGMLRINIIGRSNENDVVFARSTAFKGTSSNGSPLSYALYTGNYDFANGRPLTGKLRTAAAGGAVQTLQLQEPLAVEPGRNLMLWDDTKNDSVIVQAVSADNRSVTVRSVDGATLPTYAAGADVQAAAVLTDGLPSLNGDGAGTAGATLEPLRDVRDTLGVYLAGGLRAEGVASITSTTNTGAAKMAVTGPLEVESAAARINLTPITTAVTTSNHVTVQSRDSVSRIRPVHAPVLDSGGFSRYRQLTQYAAPARGSAYGYGPGLYLDNSQDFERIAGRRLANYELHRLWQRKPITLKTDAGTPLGTTGRYYWPRPGEASDMVDVTTPSRTLEERGVRGWINPWEYLPRGVLIELKGDEIIVTRDDRSDDDLFLNKPDPRKAWRDAAGRLEWEAGGSDLATQNAYRMVINTVTNERSIVGASYTTPETNDFNGVIFAEGNVRVRGYLGNRDLTIVSMGNIYIEGNLRKGTRNIALLAKKNVVVNPTQMVAHPDGWQSRDVYTANEPQIVSATATALTVQPGMGLCFRVGDSVRVLSGDGAWHTVTSIVGDTLTVAPAFAAAPAAGSAVRLLVDPAVRSGLDAVEANERTSEYYFELPPDTTASVAGVDTLVRTARFDGLAGAPSPAPLFLHWQNSGQMAKALDMTRQTASAGTVGIKSPTSTPGVILAAEKTLKGNTQPATEDFALDLRDVDGNPGLGGDTIETLLNLPNRLNHFSPAPDLQPDWEVAIVAGKENVAARRLAATSPLLGGREVHSAPTFPSSANSPAALSVSVGLYFNNSMVTGLAGLLPANPADPVTNLPVSVLGSSLAITPDADESVDTVGELFYWRHSTAPTDDETVRVQAPLRMLSRQLAPMLTANLDTNYFGFSRDIDNNLPAYRVGKMNVSFDDYAVNDDFFAVPMSIEANIYAQEGSWFVLPAPMTIRYGAGVDVNGDGKTYDSEQPDVVAAAAAGAADSAAAASFRRPNYHISVLGNIAQNFSPTGMVDYDSTPVEDGDGDATGAGAAAKWLDASSYPERIDAAGVPVNWDSVSYTAERIPETADLYLPVVADLIYSGS